MDDGVYDGWTVPNEYDPMLGKLISWGSDRKEAIVRLQRALDEYYAGGIKTNVSLFRRILRNPEFREGAIHTSWLDEFLKRPVSEPEAIDTSRDAAMIAAVTWTLKRSTPAARESVAAPRENPWKIAARRDQVDRDPRGGANG